MKSFLFSLCAAVSLSTLAPACANQTDANQVAAPQWTDTLSAELARQELTNLYQSLQSAHYDLYVHRSRADYEAKLQAMLAAFDRPMTRYDLSLELQKFTAYGNVAHARIDYPSEVFDAYRAESGRYFPIYLRIANGRAYIGEDYSGVEGLSPGDEILSLNAMPIEGWLNRTASHISADTDYIAHSLLEFSFPKYLWVELGEQTEFDLTIRGQTGEARSVEIPARSRQEILAAAEAAPAYFALDDVAREARMLDNNIAYLRPGPFFNAENPDQIWNATDFSVFVDEAFNTFLEQEAEVLIIDLRDNPGGDNSFSDLIISWIADERFRFASDFLVRSSDEAAASNQKRIDANPEATDSISYKYAEAFAATPRGETFSFDIPFAHPRKGERFQGEVYVLINRHSFSNAVNTASIFQDYGWGVIAGEKTSDMATTYGAMESFTLPITGFEVGFPKAHIIRPSGERESDGVAPDLPIETPIAASTEDVVLNTLIEHIQSN